jgi:hypothetical protein
VFLILLKFPTLVNYCTATLYICSSNIKICCVPLTCGVCVCVCVGNGIVVTEILCTCGCVYLWFIVQWSILYLHFHHGIEF